MTVEGLMRQTVTLRKLTGHDHDGADSVPAYTESTTEMYLEPVSGEEDPGGAGRNTPLGDWRGVGRKDVDFDSWDLVVYDGKVLDIVSPSRPFFNPRIGAGSHVELDLREIDQ